MTDTALLAAIAAQEKALVFEPFTLETAWRLGTALRDHAAHGGGFPLILAGLGCIGVITTSSGGFAARSSPRK